MKISEEIIFLYQKIQSIYRRRQQLSRDENRIEVDDQITSHLASLYEKLRNSVDFKEIHLLRRFAIERNIKRRFIVEALKPEIARGLILDLIRSRYLPSGSVLELKVREVENVIAKYNQLYLLMNDLYHGKDIEKYFDWLIAIEACEIDEVLNPEEIEDAVIEAMYQVTNQRIKIRGDDLGIREKNIQLYIAIHRSLVKSDDTIISYHLLNLYYDKWLIADENLIKNIAAHLPDIYNNIQKKIHHPHQRKILAAIREPVVTFQVLYELIIAKGHDFEEYLVNPDLLEVEAKLIINQRYKKIRKKIGQASLRAIIYIFITKVLVALLLELPYENYILQHINYINLGINVVFPPLLMFLVTLSVRPPKQDNTAKILANLRDLIYGQPSRSILCQLKIGYRLGYGFQIFYYLMYTLLYIFVFGAIIYFLRKLNFNILSGGIFIFFLTAVSFFAIRIRNSAKEYLVLKKKEGALSFLMNFFSLPIVAVGRWMSRNFRKINVFAFVMDYIIEAPFKLFISVLEDWFGFMKEKKEEVFHDQQ